MKLTEKQIDIELAQARCSLIIGRNRGESKLAGPRLSAGDTREVKTDGGLLTMFSWKSASLYGYKSEIKPFPSRGRQPSGSLAIHCQRGRDASLTP